MSVADQVTSAGFVGWLVFAAGLVVNVVALGVIPGNRKPSSGMAWLLLVVVAPFVGVVAFAFFGTTDIGRRRQRRRQRRRRGCPSRARGRGGGCGEVPGEGEAEGTVPEIGGGGQEGTFLEFPPFQLLSGVFASSAGQLLLVPCVELWPVELGTFCATSRFPLSNFNRENIINLQCCVLVLLTQT
jgi:hypothetical protein